MSVTIDGHRLQPRQIAALDMVHKYLVANAGDSTLSGITSPRGDGRAIDLREIFPERNNVDNGRRRIISHLDKIGVLRACEIYLKGGWVKAEPSPAVQAEGSE